MTKLEFDRLGSRAERFLLSDLEIDLHFRLSASEIASVLQRRGVANRLGLAVQIGLLRMLGQPPKVTTRIQPEVLSFLGEQLGLSVPEIAGLRSLYPRRATRFQHRREAKEIAGFRPVTDGVQRGLVAYLNQKSAEVAAAKDLVKAARIWLRERLYIPPNTRVLARLCRNAFNLRLRLFELDIRTDVNTSDWKNALLKDTKDEAAGLDYLRSGPRKRSESALANELAKIKILRELGAEKISLSDMPPAVVTAHARRIAGRPPSVIKRLGEPGRTVALACFLKWELARRLDLTIDMLLHLVTDHWRRAHEDARARLAADAWRARDRFDSFVADLEPLLSDDDLSRADLKSRIEALISSHRSTLPERTNRSEMARRIMAERGAMLKRLTRHLPDLGFSMPPEHPWANAISGLEDTHLRIENADTFAPVWQTLLKDPDPAIADGAWHAATLLSLKRALRNGSVYLPKSNHWRAPEKYLVPDRLWRRDKGRYIRDMGVQASSNDYIKAIEAGIDKAVASLADAVEEGSIRITNDRISLPRATAYTSDPDIDRTRDGIIARIGPQQLPDVIVDVDQAVGFSRILLGREASNPREQLQLYAALLGLGSDLDATQVARMIAEASPDGIGRFMRRIEHEDRLRTANEAIVAALQALPIAKQWGDGVAASADMMSLETARDLWQARIDPRRKSKSVGTYTHVLDQWALIYDQPVILNESQAGPAIEGALRQNGPPIDRVAVDTHGTTHMGTVLAKLLGFDLCPRLANLSKRKLFVFPDTALPQCLEPVASRALSRQRIARGWDGLLRLASSTKSGWCSANWALSRNGSAASADPVKRAGDDLGKLLRTLYLADYLSNPEFRSEIGRLLARGEASHTLQRALYDGTVSLKFGRTRSQLKAVSGSLTLLANIVIFWNAMAFDRIVQSPDFNRPLSHLSSIAPIIHRHINLRGIFHFDLARNAQTKEIPPRIVELTA